ncbi:hypothetical protein NVIE_022700 [Nitrososphaera viennensis EN76]|uniref:Uncharacterized protein n=2 Tax=Nitrososphaera viennensis TaxID=1034015 RepID=A0A060HST4_9ARCH|nr:hypothetical protein NVIE_022700 [Nitrososphaera viennensis EN76]
MGVIRDFAAGQGLDARMVDSKDSKNVVSMVVRHDGGEHFSFFCARCFSHFFNLLTLKRVSVEHDPSTIFIRLELATDEVDGMKHYLDEVLEEIKSSKSRKEEEEAAAAAPPAMRNNADRGK